ncbi:YIR protein, partial [Plasmodium yoelii]
CGSFDTLRNYLPDGLVQSKERDFHDLGSIVNYCPSEGSEKNECKTDLDKTKAGFLWLFEQIIVNHIDGLSKEQAKAFITYIMIWLNYMLNLKKVNDTNLNGFYTKYTENNMNYTKCKNGDIDCSNSLKDKTGYNNFTEIINERKDLLNIRFEDPFKLYYSFKLLCNMYYEINDANPDSDKYLKTAKQFVEKYKELNGDSDITEDSPYLNGDSDITEDSPYYQVLSTLSNDYNNIINECTSNLFNCINFPSLPTYSRRSVIKNTLISIAFIFASVSIFLGIAYKYSLFGFRKRFQKQKLREKLKNIKKRINH